MNGVGGFAFTLLFEVYNFAIPMFVGQTNFYSNQIKSLYFKFNEGFKIILIVLNPITESITSFQTHFGPYKRPKGLQIFYGLS